MRHPFCGLWLLLGLAIGLPLSSHGESLLLSAYEGDITKLDHSDALVSVRFVTEIASTTPSTVIIRLANSEQLKNLEVKDASGHLFHPAITSSPSGVRFSMPLTATVAITYGVHADGEDLTVIPLPVPSATPPSESKLVHLAIHLPAGEVAFGDLFPNMTWSTSTDGSATLLSVPSFLIVHSKPPAEISIREKIFTSDNMANVGMLILLLLGLGRLFVFLCYRSAPRKVQEI